MAKSGNGGNGGNGPGKGGNGPGNGGNGGNGPGNGGKGGNGPGKGPGKGGNGPGKGGNGPGNGGNGPGNGTNPAGLIGSLMGFANNITGNVGETYGGAGNTNPDGLNNSENNKDSKNDINLNEEAAKNEAAKKNAEKSNDGFLDNYEHFLDSFRQKFISKEKRVAVRNNLPADVVKKGDEAYTEARKEGKTEAEAQYEARQAVRKAPGYESHWEKRTPFSFVGPVDAFEGKNTGPTYDPSVTAKATTNPTIADGSSKMGHSTSVTNNAPAAPTTTPAANNTPGGNLGGETGGIVSGAAPTNTSDATNTDFTYNTSDASNTGVTNRGSTVANGGGTSVTDSGTGGSISSSITPPSRDASSIGLGVYNTDRANYDQDNWNRGMEVESSSLVSDEECKAFAKRAFMENSEPFKKVRVTIIKKC